MKHDGAAVLCCDEDHADLARLRDALDRITGGGCLVEGFRNGGRLAGRIAQLHAEGVLVPVVFVDETLMDGLGVDALMSLHTSELGRPIHKILLARDPADAGLSKAIRAGALAGTVGKPWTDQHLRSLLARHLTEFFIDQDPPMLERIPALIDVGVLAHAFSVREERARETRSQLEDLQSSFFADSGMSDDDVEQAMIEEIDRVLGRPERQLYPAGSTLLRSGDPVNGIQIVLWGQVRLFRSVDGQEVTFHSRTAGRIIGLLALSRTQPAFFSCAAETDVEVIPLSFEQLSAALHRSPTLAVNFVSVLVRSLARRNIRTVELQLERDRLTRDLEAMHEPLTDVRTEIEEALVLLEPALEGIELECHFGDVAGVQARPGELNLAWMNLLVDAIRAMGGAGKLEIRIAPVNVGVSVEIIDSRPQISPEDIEEMLSQPGGGVKPGLGLRIARDVIHRHGGSIEVRSQLGRTSSAVVLPARSESAQGSGAES